MNGLRSVIRKGSFQWIQSQNFDVICLQEIKACKEQLPPDKQEIQGYESYWNCASRRGYSGVVTFTRRKPIEVVYGLGDDIFDGEGRVIRIKFPEYYLFNVYFPSGQRGLERVDYKLQFYECLLDQCIKLHRQGNNIIITGDFNTAHREVDLSNPKSNQKTSGFLPVERAWVDRYLDNNFVDIYRNRYPDRVQYTWWTYTTSARIRNIGWRLDYFLVSHTLVDEVLDVVIHDDVLGSDHCPVQLQIKDSES